MAETREARTLSGADVGRVVWLESGARGVLHQVGHSHTATTIRLGLTSYALDPTDLVTVRDVE